MTSKTLVSFDYAIKYLLKDKSNYDIVEGFISALLQSEGYGPIKINGLLESESNRETKSLKRSVADLLVEDEKGTHYIVEIEREYSANFIHKACFNTCRLIVDNIVGGSDYMTIKKVFHISLLYFAPSDLKKPLYHGKTIIHEIDTDHPMRLHLADLGGKTFDITNVLPEYFLIFVPLFDDVIKKEIDEWLYVMKHSEVREDFKSPYMHKVAERLSILKMNDQEREDYFRYSKQTLTQRDYINAAEEKGIEKGIEKGRKEGEEKGIEKGREAERKVMINQLYSSGMDIDSIHKFTKISKEELTKWIENASE
jgi:predicted transposase/invertase (TIGR01784 family)